ncbi:hypothetical protein L226DRAFT_573657 [Lentinus tigrinus ALCF2SS1-7]|nr:hypothetical protein L226DRAFT_573657 [Lentinus tigrinus ALCF2SS1-7]
MPSRTLQLPDAIPTELWELILCELSVEELSECMLVCRKFAEIIVYQRLRYNSKLHDNALVDGEDSDASLRVRLDKLRRYHRAWEQLVFPMDGGKELVRSVSSHIHTAPAPIVLPSGWISMMDTEGGLLFVRVPAVSSSTEPPRHNGWFFAHRLPASLFPDYNSYRFDPSQDLVVLLTESQHGRCCDVHVRSMATGLQHPKAQHSTLDRGEEPIMEPSSFRIHEDLCAVLALKDPMSDERVLHVWDWETGHLLLVQSGFHAWGDIISFLGDRTLLIVHDECLQLHYFDDDGEVHTTTLALPSFQQEAIQVWTTVSQPYAQAEPGRAFACDPASEVVVINMVRGTGSEDQTQVKSSILLIVRVASLLKHADAGIGEDSLTLSWEEWGPECSRFFRVPDTCSWEAPTTFGRRVLIPYYRDGEAILAVLDFDVDGEHVGTPTYETSEGWAMSLSKAPVLEDYSQWLEEDCKLVKSEVPCRIRCRRLHNLPARLVGASLLENGFLLKVADENQCDYVTMMLNL